MAVLKPPTPALKRWLGTFEQLDRWISCLTAARLQRIRSEHDGRTATGSENSLCAERTRTRCRYVFQGLTTAIPARTKSSTFRVTTARS